MRTTCFTSVSAVVTSTLETMFPRRHDFSFSFAPTKCTRPPPRVVFFFAFGASRWVGNVINDLEMRRQYLCVGHGAKPKVPMPFLESDIGRKGEGFNKRARVEWR